MGEFNHLPVCPRCAALLEPTNLDPRNCAYCGLQAPKASFKPKREWTISKDAIASGLLFLQTGGACAACLKEDEGHEHQATFIERQHIIQRGFHERFRNYSKAPNANRSFVRDIESCYKMVGLDFAKCSASNFDKERPLQNLVYACREHNQGEDTYTDAMCNILERSSQNLPALWAVARIQLIRVTRMVGWKDDLQQIANDPFDQVSSLARYEDRNELRSRIVCANDDTVTQLLRLAEGTFTFEPRHLSFQLSPKATAPTVNWDLLRDPDIYDGIRLLRAVTRGWAMRKFWRVLHHHWVDDAKGYLDAGLVHEGTKLKNRTSDNLRNGVFAYLVIRPIRICYYTCIIACLFDHALRIAIFSSTAQRTPRQHEELFGVLREEDSSFWNALAEIILKKVINMSYWPLLPIEMIKPVLAESDIAEQIKSKLDRVYGDPARLEALSKAKTLPELENWFKSDVKLSLDTIDSVFASIIGGIENLEVDQIIDRW